nr:retrotransposon-related protein [Tanacetum cinerariifolium]
MGTVVEYESEFVVLANRVTGISESLLTSFCISGLKLTLQIDLLRARPISLVEAFALARITEARFEDERATTVITKPNEGGPPDHVRASEKELAVLKSSLEQKSMLRRQERMLRRQEQQRLAKDAKIQRRIWDPGIKSLQDNTLRAMWF